MEFDFGKKKRAPKQPVVQQEPSFSDDYNYDFLLTRLFDEIPNDSSQRLDEFKCDIPKVFNDGPRKTRWLNFSVFPAKFEREAQHLKTFVGSDLCCETQLDSENRLILSGRFTSQHLQTVLKNYLHEYVQCHACKKYTTLATKKKKETFVVCSSCGASRCPLPISIGYRAVSKSDRIKSSLQK